MGRAYWTEHKARKSNICSFCGDDILRGELYKSFTTFKGTSFKSIDIQRACKKCFKKW